MSCHTLEIDSNLKIKHIFLNLLVLYTEIFSLKAYNSVKTQQMTEIFLDVICGTRCYRIMQKARGQKSHATVPLKRQCHDIFDFKSFHLKPSPGPIKRYDII